jgi:hypothetical protein
MPCWPMNSKDVRKLNILVILAIERKICLNIDQCEEKFKIC